MISSAEWFLLKNCASVCSRVIDFTFQFTDGCVSFASEWNNLVATGRGTIAGRHGLERKAIGRAGFSWRTVVLAFLRQFAEPPAFARLRL